MKVCIKKNIKNDNIIEFIKIIKEMNNNSQDIILSLFKQSQKIKIRTPIIVAITILKRVIECVNAIIILSITGYEKDTAILLLNIIELRLDISYIAIDCRHADTWLNHDKENRKPWKVNYLINKLYGGNELKAEQNNYKRFSMIKHGNPMGGFTSFPFIISDGNLIIKEKENIDDFLSIYLFGCGIECCKTNKAIINIGENYNYKLDKYKEKLNTLDKCLNDLNYKHVKSMISELQKQIKLPELCKKCIAVPEGFIEVRCLLKQVNADYDNFECEFFKQK